MLFIILFVVLLFILLPFGTSINLLVFPSKIFILIITKVIALNVNRILRFHLNVGIGFFDRVAVAVALVSRKIVVNAVVYSTTVGVGCVTNMSQIGSMSKTIVAAATFRRHDGQVEQGLRAHRC